MTDRDRLNRHLDHAKLLCMVATGRTSAERVGATDGDWPTICREVAADVRARAGSDSTLWRLSAALEFAAQDVQTYLGIVRADDASAAADGASLVGAA